MTLVTLEQIYGTTNQDRLIKYLNRCRQVKESHKSIFNDTDVHLFSCPGRVEICGNHTDHNGGKVLTASIDVDAVAAGSASATSFVTLVSSGFASTFKVDTKDLEKNAHEDSTTALIKGVLQGLKSQQCHIGGANIYLSSDVLAGSGVSSSAVIELIISKVMDYFYNNNALPLINLARAGQYAENNYWNKPSGLLDQMGCGLGGAAYLSFKDKNAVEYEAVKFDFSAANYSLILVDTGGSHAALTDEYSKVPREMFQIAEKLGVARLVELPPERLFQSINDLRETCGDRALLRAIHFYDENDRVDSCVLALKTGKFNDFLANINLSGRSSLNLLQNCYDISNSASQPIPVMLALTERYIRSKGLTAACRVHGGGFAGMILAIIPNQHVNDYVSTVVTPTVGASAARVMQVRPVGVCVISSL